MISDKEEDIFIEALFKISKVANVLFLTAYEGAKRRGRGVLMIYFQEARLDYEYWSLQQSRRNKKYRRKVVEIGMAHALTASRVYDIESEFVMILCRRCVTININQLNKMIRGPCMGQCCPQKFVSVDCDRCGLTMYCSQQCFEDSKYLHYMRCPKHAWGIELGWSEK